MPERKGSLHARALFHRPVDPDCLAEWKEFDANYHHALQILASENKRTDLVELDNYVHETLPELVRARSPPHLLHAELAQVMKWKLTRGKFRPLQKLVESNTSLSVMDASADSFRLLAKGDWDGAFDAMTQLRGVGVATASGIFSLIAPDICPFMADEVLEGVTSETREYSMRAYRAMRTALLAKAEELQTEGWNAERVGRALWSCAIINANLTPTTRKRPVASTKSMAKKGETEAASATRAGKRTSSAVSVEGDDVGEAAESKSSKKRKFSG